MNIIEAKNKTLTILATLNDIENGMTETARLCKKRNFNSGFQTLAIFYQRERNINKEPHMRLFKHYTSISLLYSSSGSLLTSEQDGKLLPTVDTCFDFPCRFFDAYSDKAV